MAYGKIKADKIVYDNGTSDVEVNVSALAGAGSTAPTNDPAFTGTPTAPTAAQGTNTTQIATTEFVNAEIAADTATKAPIASPTFTGVPAGPTAAQGTNTTQLATTGFVNAEIAAEIAGKANIASPTFTGTPTAPTVTYNAASPSTTLQLATHEYLEQAIPQRIYYTSAAATGNTLATHNNYTTDTSSAAYSVTLPASPSVGAHIRVMDAAGAWNTNNLTIQRNGEKISGSSNDLVCNVANATVNLHYSGSTVGWLVK
tara:strand:+ start:2780 stop:3553 length:774 start_codon:yes stop_codon:yes gene_type:complete